MESVVVTNQPGEIQEFSPHPRYRWMALGSGLLFLLLGWNLVSPMVRGESLIVSEVDRGLLFFMVVAAAIALWYLRLALSRVSLSPSEVTLHGPLMATKTVSTQQMTGLSVSGRSGHAVTLLYHPSGRNDLIDPDEIASLTLPEVDDQDALLAELESWVPA